MKPGEDLVGRDGLRIAPFAGARIETIEEDADPSSVRNRPLRGGAD